MPVCARCLGVYAGAVTGGVLFWLTAAPLARFPSPRTLLLCAAPTALDWTTEWLGLRPPLASLRVVTGAIFATGAAFSLIPGFALLTARLQERVS